MKGFLNEHPDLKQRYEALPLDRMVGAAAPAADTKKPARFPYPLEVDGDVAATCDGSQGLIAAVAAERWRRGLFEGAVQ